MATRAGEATRTKIMDASERLILGQGFAATSIDEIIGRVGITKGAFFYHFPSKNALAMALIERFAEADLSNLHTSLERAEMNSPTKISSC